MMYRGVPVPPPPDAPAFRDPRQQELVDELMQLALPELRERLHGIGADTAAVEAAEDDQARLAALFVQVSNGGAAFPHAQPAGAYTGPSFSLATPTSKLAAEIETNGFVVLRGAVSRRWVQECATAFAPRLDEYIRRKGGPNDPATRNRGPFRHYIDLPLRRPFSDLFADERLHALMAAVLGPAACVTQFASDTPLGRGSTYQIVHNDLGAHDGEWPAERLAINWPLCDVTDLNGPFEMAVGGHTHRRNWREAERTGVQGVWAPPLRKRGCCIWTV